MPQARLRTLSLSPSRRKSARFTPSRASSDYDESDSDSTMAQSRPTSMAIPPPSLRDILSNTAPPPYTFGAFLAFLSHNHCLETLEFTLGADQYRKAYDEIMLGRCRPTHDGLHQLRSLWEKLMNAYIRPNSSHEVNLPAHVRDRLVQLSCAEQPPCPAELDQAVAYTYDLMDGSVLGPFLESLAPSPEPSPAPTQPTHSHSHSYSHSHSHSQSRSYWNNLVHDPRRTHNGASPPPHHDGPHSNRSSKASGLLPLHTFGWQSETSSRSASSSTVADSPIDGFTDDSSSGYPSGNEPMTPPTTPPSSDWTFGTSPSGISRAMHTSGWKKMGAKLGLGKKSRSKRSQTTSVMPALDGAPSSPCLYPTTSGESTDTDEAMEDVADVKLEFPLLGQWEESTPGQHIPSPMAGNDNTVQDAGREGRLHKDGMAAKGYTPYIKTTPEGAARRFTRPRVRRAASSNPRVTGDKSAINKPATSSPLRTCSASNLRAKFLAIDHSQEQYLKPPTVDPYGWEAAYGGEKLEADDEKICLENFGFDEATLAKLTYRRAGGERRNLFHRMFAHAPRADGAAAATATTTVAPKA
ncbi:hypothetical protein B0T20DRAFT_488408 [Sordaria brevicollis]|uniref:RGS domain-containing protein n=1 Tax=Sordaria brevicollis TaxID=83679 RepID=A0AAE0P413_SORBR|nr:hypothetical protein B0T20DRAFT_488408 [Sordaria brevicollis]